MALNIADIFVYFFLFIAIYFEVFMLLSFFEGKKAIDEEAKGDAVPEHFPSATIIVPCFNEETTIHGTVDSLLALEYPKDKLDIILVDDGSRDNTWNVIQEFEKHPQIKTYKKENGGKYTALNYGIKESKTELVGCLDADSFVAPDALKKIVCHFANPAVMAVTPAIRIHNPSTILQHVQHIEYNIGIIIKKIFALLGAIHVTPGPFTIFRKEVFEKVGYFRHAHNTEDMEMALRLHSHNLKIENSHNAWVYTVGPRTVRALYKQRVRWTHGFLENAIDYRHLFFNKKYGNIGFLTLPFSAISIFGFIILIGISFSNIVGLIYKKALIYQTVGFDPHFHLSFNWFYVNTRTTALLSVVTLTLTVVFMLMAKRLVGERGLVSRDMIYYFIFYPFIAPFWLLKSVYNTAFSKKSSWR